MGLTYVGGPEVGRQNEKTEVCNAEKYGCLRLSEALMRLSPRHASPPRRSLSRHCRLSQDSIRTLLKAGVYSRLFTQKRLCSRLPLMMFLML